MEKINDTLLINIDIGSDNGDLSVVEVVTHIGTVRTVLNTFIGKDAELIYQTLVNKHAQKVLLAQMSSFVQSENVQTKTELYSFGESEPYLTLETNIAEELTDVEEDLPSM